MSPNSQTIPNAGLVTFAKFDITAGSEDAAISSIKLERQGLSNRIDIDRVYFEQNSKRISSRGSVNIDDEVIVSFTPALVVKAGSTETIDLVVQLNKDATGTDSGATVGAEHRFAVVEVESSTDVAGNLPVVTNTMKLGSYTVSEVTFEATKSSGTEINVWDSNILVGEFELDTIGDKDNLFKSVTFRNNGGADMETVFANIGLYNDGVEVSTEVIVEGREITFIVNHEIENGRNENYEIRADLVSTDREGDTFELELRNTTDLNVVEIDTNFSAPVTIGTEGDVMEEYTLVGGELLLTRDSEYTNTDTVSASTNDVVLLAAKLRVDEAITVEDLSMDYTTDSLNSLVAQYRDLKLVVDGRTISTYTPTVANDNGTTGGTITFDGTFLVENNSSVMVLGNLKNSVNNNAWFKLSTLEIKESTTWDLRYVSNDEKIDGISGAVDGVKVTVAEAELLITQNDGLSSEQLVSGARDVTLFGFSIRANDVSDVKVTSLKPIIVDNTGTEVSEEDITNIRLYEGSTLLKTENDFDFNSLNLVIAKNTAKSFKIVADFNTSITGGENIQLLLAGSNVSARNVESNQLLSNDSIEGTDSALFTFAESGVLTVSNNSSSRSSSIVAPSDSEVDVFTFDLKATDDDLRVTDLYVTNSWTLAGSGDLDLAGAIRSVSLSVDGRVIDGAVVSKNVLYFPVWNSNPIVLERDETVKAEVRVAFSDSNTRESATFALEIGNGDYNPVNGTVNGIRVISDSTGIELDNDTTTQVSVSNVVSNTHMYARSLPVVTDGSAQRNEQKFTISADANRKVTVKELTIDVNVSAATLDASGTGNLRLYVGNNVVTDAVFALSWSELSVTGLTEEISAGSTQEFEIRNLDQIITLTDAADASRTMRVFGLVYEADIDTTDSITIDNDTNEFVNTGIPTTGTTFNNY